MAEGGPAALVVVCHYDGRPVAPLVDLLRQVRAVPAGAPFEVLVVVNSVTGVPPALPRDLAGTDVLMRANSGYNLEAWQAGWRARPGHPFHLFVQDDCVIRRAGWLRAFLRCAARPRTGFVGEAETLQLRWNPRGWPLVRARFAQLCAAEGLPPDLPPFHLQSVVMGARREVLERTGGFLSAPDKAGAVAAEVLTSVRARHMGFVNRQVAYHPYSVIGHPQWDGHARAARRLRWRVTRALRLGLVRGMDAAARLRRATAAGREG